MKHYKYLIVGGGMTGDAAVRGIRELDLDGSIGMISSEKDMPYARPPLTKGMWKGRPFEKVWRGTDTKLARTVAQARAELEARRDALARIEETHAASIERYKAGDLSVIDTLTTEQERTSARLQLVGAERNYLSLVAQLRFETGGLVELPGAADGSLAGARLVPLGEPLL